MASVETKTFDNGDEYKGWVDNGKRQKYGQMKMKDGTRLEGEFKNDKVHGMAFCQEPDGSQYIGRYSEGKRQGIGCLNNKTF